MSFTYNAADLDTSDLYQVRFKIGDTDSSDALLQDEEINYLLAEYVSVKKASIQCCLNLAAKFARQVDYKLGPHSVSASKRATHFRQLAQDLSVGDVGSSAYPIYTGPTEERTIFDVDMMNDDICSHSDEEDE